MTTTTLHAPRTLADLVPRTSSRFKAIAINCALMAGFALFTALMAQVSFKLSFTPVPITGQTMAVLVSGAALGSAMGAGSQIIYLVSGLFLPFYANGSSGYTTGEGGTSVRFGYIVGFIFASALVGYLAERRNDRNVISAFTAFIAGSAIIYIFGAGWLAHELGIPVFNGEANAMAYGVTPYLIGDVLKAICAGALLPGAWALVTMVNKRKKTDSV